jgi:tetratricopeptide (TPR) repeat protein
MKAKTAAVSLTILLLFTIGSRILAQDGTTAGLLFEEANSAYSSGDYEAAISSYERIIGQSGFSSSVLYNLANGYARNGQTGKAIVNYERALLLSPNDSDILGNLQLVKKESGLFVREYSWLEKILFALSFDGWATLLLASLVILAAFYAGSLFFATSRKSTLTFTTLWVILFGLLCAGGYSVYQKSNPSIVISPGARLLVSPFEDATSIGKIQEGRRVYPLTQHRTYTYVVDETERKGWIADSDLEAVRQL